MRTIDQVLGAPRDDEAERIFLEEMVKTYDAIQEWMEEHLPHWMYGSVDNVMHWITIKGVRGATVEQRIELKLRLPEAFRDARVQFF